MKNWTTWSCQWGELLQVLGSVELLVRVIEVYWLGGKTVVDIWFYFCPINFIHLVRYKFICQLFCSTETTDNYQTMLERSYTGKLGLSN
jgi:hypothetical protein